MTFDYIMGGRGMKKDATRSKTIATKTYTATRTVASVSQPRRNGPLVMTTKTVPAFKEGSLISKVYNYLRTGPRSLAQLTSRFHRTNDSISATVRDLRKHGLDVELLTLNGRKVYSLAA